MLAVADGVGGWARHGIDSGTFSGGLLRFLKKEHQKTEKKYSEQANSSDNEFRDTPYEVSKLMKNPIIPLERAYKKVLSSPECQGSSTVVTANFDKKTGKVYTSNLGDSGFIIMKFNENQENLCHNPNTSFWFHNKFRSNLGKENDNLIFEYNDVSHLSCESNQEYSVAYSEDQLHGFNFPYQISYQPHDKADTPASSDVANFQLSIGDIIILASDGVLDNLFVKDIENIVLQERYKYYHNVERFLEKAALRIAEDARTLSWDDEYLSPFSVKARESNRRYQFEKGGKVDDTTVIVAVVGYN